MAGETRTIRLQVGIPVTVELIVKYDADGEQAEILEGQVVGESHKGHRWVTEHVDEGVLVTIDEAAGRAFQEPE